MSHIEETYRHAADQAVTEAERYDSWRVFGYYRVKETDRDAIAVADRTVPKDVKPVKGPESFEYLRRDGSRERLRRINVVERYMPLADKEYADLFDRFARLADRGEIGQQEWLDWLHEYGVLGFRGLGADGKTGGKNTVSDIYSVFVREARQANQMRRLFGAATLPDGPDVGTIARLLPGEYREYVSGGRGELAQAALFAIQDTVELKVHADCRPRLLARDGDEWRTQRVGPFLREWSFDSLLGAMWLQFMWLVTTDNLRYCEAPGCNNPISPYAKATRTTCDDRCRQRKRRQQEKRSKRT